MGPDSATIDEFLQAAIRDQARALALLGTFPQLVETRILHKETFLHYLAVEGHAQAVWFLANNGFDVNVTNEFGDSPLMDAARISDSLAGCREVVLTLLALGADPNVSSLAGSPLYVTAEHGDVELVRALLGAGAVPDKGDDLFGPPIHAAIKNGHTEVVKLLLESGADPNYETSLQENAGSVLHNSDSSIARLLTQYGWWAE